MSKVEMHGDSWTAHVTELVDGGCVLDLDAEAPAREAVAVRLDAASRAALLRELACGLCETCGGDGQIVVHGENKTWSAPCPCQTETSPAVSGDTITTRG